MCGTALSLPSRSCSTGTSLSKGAGSCPGKDVPSTGPHCLLNRDDLELEGWWVTRRASRPIRFTDSRARVLDRATLHRG